MNLPNKITLTRICLIPVMLLFYYLTVIPGNRLIAAAVFVLAACTDFLDGHLARKNNQVTNMGKFLDPIADKVLVLVALFMLVESGIIPSPYGVLAGSVIIAREIAISGFRQIAAANNLIIAADKSGKIKTVFQDVAIVVLLAALGLADMVPAEVTDVLTWCGWGLLAVAVALTIYSGIHYVVKNYGVLKDSQ